MFTADGAIKYKLKDNFLLNNAQYLLNIGHDMKTLVFGAKKAVCYVGHKGPFRESLATMAYIGEER